MKKNSLSSKGLSLSQAQSISNLCNQRAIDIAAQLNGINNVEKTLVIGENTYVETPGKPMPTNLVDLLIEKAKLHACQAFLMENIKAKDSLLKELKYKEYESDLVYPEKDKLKTFDTLPQVGEEFGWSQLTVDEYNEFLESEAYAAHIGQFIHKNGPLDTLRHELPFIKTLEWFEVEQGKKTPLTVKIHHTNEQLLGIHDVLAAMHRNYEQRVNYYKAKVKDLTTAENARIARYNADGINKANADNLVIESEFRTKYNEYISTLKEFEQKCEESRQNEISEVASLRINIDPRFQEVIDKYLSQLN
jgi:hypothetical protein